MRRLSLLIAIGLATVLLHERPVLCQTEQGWAASKESESKWAKDRPGLNFYELGVPVYYLPDPLTTQKIKSVRTANAWERIRRPEVLELFRKNVFGRVPETSYKQEFTTTLIDSSMLNGNATLKKIDIKISRNDKSLTIHLTLLTPADSAVPVPVFLLINNRVQDLTDLAGGRKSEFWPAADVIARGYGIAVFQNSDVDPDKYDDFKDGIHGMLDSLPRGGDSWATISAWAWGASRCLDYLVSDPDVDRNKVVIVGHSRGGKTALWAGAEDERFGMVIANESGCGGAALARRKLGETVLQINTSFPHWFCTNFRKYNGNENSMMFDMHMLLALSAPRPLYISAASEDLWGDPKGCYLSLYNSLPVYRLFDRKISMSGLLPALSTQVTSSNTGFHIRPGSHDLNLEDWNFFMDFADKVWRTPENKDKKTK